MSEKYLNQTQTIEQAIQKQKEIIQWQQQVQPMYSDYFLDTHPEIEEWRPVVYSNIKRDMYEVSNYSRVRNIHTGRILAQVYGSTRYRYIGVQTVDNGRRSVNVYRLVATAFIPKTEEDILLGRDTVNHINLFPDDSRVCNLESTTNEENLAYARLMHEDKIPIYLVERMSSSNWSNGYCTSGENNGMAKYSDEVVHTICKCREQGMSYKECAAAAGLPDEYNSLNYVSMICRGLKRKDISSQYNIDRVSYHRPKVSYSEQDIINICELIAKGYSNRDICKMLGLDGREGAIHSNVMETLQRIRKKKNYKNISDQYF